MSVLCPAVHVALHTVGPSAVSGPLAAHVAGCATCEADCAEFILVEEALASLGPSVHSAPGHLPAAVMASLGPVAVPDSESRASLAIPVAAAAFIATAAAGTAVLIRLRRQSAA